MTPTPSPATGVLVMAHGTPSSPEGIAPFYTAIRRGRPPPPELLDELVARYRAIGGTSPLTERTLSQVHGVTATLDADAPGRYRVAYGTKYASPSIEEGMAELVDAGVNRVIGLVLTPHQSTLGSGEYLRRAAAGARAVPFTAIPSWHRAPGFAELMAERTAAALNTLDADARRSARVFFTAHSLPLRAIAEGDSYPDQVAESASDVAALLRLGDEPGVTWEVAWQSAGRTEEPWIGPDLLESMRRAAGDGVTGIVVCPVGFVADHLEILYDLDIEAAGLARSLGVAFARTPSFNDDPGFIEVLASVVRRADGPGDPVGVSGPSGPAGAAGPADSGAGVDGHRPSRPWRRT